MKILSNPKIILIIYVIAIILHPIFYLCDFSYDTLTKIDSVVVLSTIIISITGITYICATGLTRTRWAYLSLLIILCVSRLYILFQNIFNLGNIVSSDDKNAVIITFGAALAFVFVIYPIEALRPKYFNARRFLIFLSPIIFLIILAFVGNLFSQIVNSQIIQIQMILGYIITTAYPLMTLFYALDMEKKHHKWCLDHYSNIESFRTSWIKYYIWGYICLHISYTYIYFDYSNSALNVQTILFFVYVILTLPFAARYKSHLLREGDDFNNVYEKTPISFNDRTGIYKKILFDYMESEKPFLNHDFKLTDLCYVLLINRSYISRLLNDEIGEKFYDFVARYRVEYSKGLLEGRSDLNISEISNLSGFTSPSVYGRTFIKFMDETPKSYRTKNKKGPKYMTKI